MKTLLLTLSLLRNILFSSPVQSQEISLEPYCKNGYYEIAGEPKCSRAPNCGGYGYDELNKADKMPSYDSCVGNSAPAGKKGCDGYVPLCCYEVARTGDFTKCIGYWERLWCTKSQCDVARTKGASDSQCGGDCQCSHAHSSYCGNKDPILLSQRLNGATPQPTSANPTPTPPPQVANCPTTSSRSYDSIDVTNVGDTRAADSHPDKNIKIRGYTLTSGTRNLIHNNGPKDSKAPQLSTVLSNSTPAIVSLYQVYNWNWGQNGALGSKGSPLTSPWDVTMIGLSATPGDDVRVPNAGYSIGNGFNATVLYAAADTITLEYTREDSVRAGYAIQYDGICVDPNLVSLYNQLNGQGRSKLPVLKNKQVIGSAKTNEVKVAVRDTGTYMDPRSDDSWWIGLTSLPNAPGITAQPTSPQLTSVITSLPNPTATPTISTACVPPLATTFIGPASTIAAGSFDIAWNPINNAENYSLRVDDSSNGWAGSCAKQQFPGDICIDNFRSTSYKYNFQAGHTYSIWVHALNRCGGWDKFSNLTVTVPQNGLTSCVIQGYKTVNDGVAGWNDTISPLKVTVSGHTQDPNSVNPYKFTVPGNASYTVSVPETFGFNIGSTYCSNRTDCHNLSDTSAQAGATRTQVYCPAGGYADLWWHFTPIYTPTPTPTLALKPGECAGVQHCTYNGQTSTSTYFEYCGVCSGPGCSGMGYSCRDPRYTCKTYRDRVFFDDRVYPVPCDLITLTPTRASTSGGCSVLPMLAWRDGDRYTRSIISYDGVNVIETIALHLKQITTSGITVQISTDNGTTWINTESSQNDDYFVTIKNRQSEFINLQVRLINTCSQSSESLSQTISTITMPTGPMTATPTGTAATTRAISREVIIAGTLLLALVVGAFFVGV